MNTLTKWDLKIGSAALGLQFVATGLYALFDTKTKFFQLMTQYGVENQVGIALIIAGACTMYGALKPLRCVRHIGQALMWVAGSWIAVVFLMIGYFPPVVVLTFIGGLGAFCIWIRDALHGRDVRMAKYGAVTEQ